MDKMRLITNCCPEAKKRRFMAKGAKKLEKEFDLMDLIMEHRHLHHYNQNGNHDFHHVIDVDYSESEILHEKSKIWQNLGNKKGLISALGKTTNRGLVQNQNLDSFASARVRVTEPIPKCSKEEDAEFV